MSIRWLCLNLLLVIGTTQGSYAQCARTDPSAPMVPSDWREPPDSTITVPGDSLRRTLYYRNRFLVVFDDSTSGRSIRRILETYHAKIVGGVPAALPCGGYVISVPDPGPNYQAVEAKRVQIGSEPGVYLVSAASYRNLIDVRAARD